MSKIIKTLALSTSILTCSFFSSYAAEVLTINTTELNEKALVTKSAIYQLDKLKKELQDELVKFNKEKDVIPKATQDKKITALREKGQLLEAKQQKALNEIMVKVSEIVSDIARKKKASIVIPKETTLYSSSDIDITDEVIKKLDKEMPKITIK